MKPSISSSGRRHGAGSRELVERIRAVDRQWIAVAAIAALALAAGAWVMLGRSAEPARVELPRANPGATAGGASPPTGSAVTPPGQGVATTAPTVSERVVVDVSARSCIRDWSPSGRVLASPTRSPPRGADVLTPTSIR